MATIELSPDQRQALDDDAELRMIDPQTRKEYVLIDANLYERIRNLLADAEEPDMRQVAVLVAQAMQEDDADDPALGFYQRKYGSEP